MLNVEIVQEEFQLNEAQTAELKDLYEKTLGNFQVGKVLNGKIVSKDNSGVL